MSAITPERARELLEMTGIRVGQAPRNMWCVVLEVLWCMRAGLGFDGCVDALGRSQFEIVTAMCILEKQVPS